MLEMATAGERLPALLLYKLAIEAMRISRLAIAKIIINYWTQRPQQQGTAKKDDYTLLFIGFAGLGLNKILINNQNFY